VKNIEVVRKHVAERVPITAQNREAHVKRRMREEMKRMQERIGQLEKELEIAKGGTENGSKVRRVYRVSVENMWCMVYSVQSERRERVVYDVSCLT
jgi:hypothetical protein